MCKITAEIIQRTKPLKLSRASMFIKINLSTVGLITTICLLMKSTF